MEFNFIELPKFTTPKEELDTTLEKWLFFLKYADELDVIPESADSVALRAAYKIADQFGWSQEELEVYDYWGIKEQDERGAVQYAVQYALKTQQRQTARKMLADGLDMTVIARYTGLSAEDIAALARMETSQE